MHKLRTTAISGLLLAALAWPASADGIAGPYLASRIAADAHDYAKAAEYGSRALQTDAANPALLADVVGSYVALGRFDRARPFAETMVASQANNQVASMVIVAELAQAGSYEEILTKLDAGTLRIAPVVDGLVRGWAQIGAGRATEGLKTFDDLAVKSGSRAFGLYHKALALALAGDYEAADAILSSRGQEKLSLTRRGVFARIEVLSQLEKDSEAADVLTSIFGTDLDPALLKVQDRLKAGETLPMTVVRSANDGLAEVFYTVATALNKDTPKDFTLAFARAAEALQPDHEDAVLLTADLLEQVGRYDLAVAEYDKIPSDGLYFYIAELGRASAYQDDGKPDDAIEVLKRLTQSHDQVPSIFVTLADALRKQERYQEATQAYSRAISLFKTPAEPQWTVYFGRGISEEREHNWDSAEADFREALKLKPNQPQVLNYLGYSFVDMNRNLDEAMDMIKKAVAERPDDGYITDSLGWAYYRMGHYKDAVITMEKAVELEPNDAVVNDHLGDVYWAVGRKREAEVQWRRALSFNPEETDATRIRRKLEVGLDQVLKEEGAEPLAVAKDG